MIQNLDDFPFVVYAIISVPLPGKKSILPDYATNAQDIFRVTTVSAPYKKTSYAI